MLFCLLCVSVFLCLCVCVPVFDSFVCSTESPHPTPACRQYREKEDQLGRFYDVLQSSHIWSSTLRQRDGSTTGDLKVWGAG